jgi:dipeptidyl aminopeptidase/acylaminoacyl peptidase
VSVLGVLLLAAPLTRFSARASAQEPQGDSREQRIVVWRAGRLASLSPDGSESAWLTSDERGVAEDLPRLSPDGKRLAYGIRTFTDPVSNEVAAQVHIREIDEPASLVDLGVSGHHWCWSGDGTKLLVATIEAADGGRPGFRHVIVDVETRHTSEIKLPAGHFATDWSADGAWFLTTSFVAREPQESRPAPQVKLVQRDGSVVRRVSDSGQAAIDGRFSPDGRMVLYTVTNPEHDTGSLYVANLSGGKPRQITPGLNEEPMGACWSPDGQRIAYVWRMRHVNPQAGQETESSLAVVDLDGNHAGTLLTETAFPREGASKTQWLIRLHSPDWR